MRLVRDVSLAEDLAQEALIAALEHWPETGIPDHPGAWLMTTAKRRGLDELRRRQMLARKRDAMQETSSSTDAPAKDVAEALDQDVGDDLLRPILIACHPVLSTDARVALTLRLVAGLTTAEIARAFLVPEPTIAQRIPCAAPAGESKVEQKRALLVRCFAGETVERVRIEPHHAA